MRVWTHDVQVARVSAIESPCRLFAVPEVYEIATVLVPVILTTCIQESSQVL